MAKRNSKKSKDLAVIQKVKINGYLQDDTVDAKRKEIDELNAEMERISKEINKLAGSQYDKAAKCIADKYNNRFIVINGDCEYETDVKNPKFEKYRMCVVKNTKPLYGCIEVITDLVINVNHYDDSQECWSMTYTKCKDYRITFLEERAVKILNKTEALELINALDINSSNLLGAMIQSVPEDKCSK